MKLKAQFSGVFFSLIFLLDGCQQPIVEVAQSSQTYCNPVNISYRFGLEAPSRREAADPTVVWFNDRYYLFASKSGGYWHSKDIINWAFIETNEIPTEEYAPTAVAIGDTLYFLASSNDKSTIYKSADPSSGHWQVAKEELEMPVWDPAFLLDTDNRLYLYWGCSNQNPLYGVEVSVANNFSFIGKPTELKHANPSQFGWEVPGDYNTLVNQAPWIEGAWVNKYEGKYYLQYSGPGTEFKSYSDGVYVSDQPLGPFTAQAHNPFAYKPEGFAAGAGHGNTFTDPYGNFWHIGTMTISQKHMFERRLGIFPAFFDESGELYSVTKFGDYPLTLPTKKISGLADIFPEWMLLSYNKPVEVSSSIDSLFATNVTDEDIRTYWAASSGNDGEYALIDLEKSQDVYAVQINFAEHATALLGLNQSKSHQYMVEYSNDKTNWTILVDKSNNDMDNTHVYFELPEKVACRYLKITNVKVPDGSFALSGFRVFGKGNGNAPDKVSELIVKRNKEDKRNVQVSWSRSNNATGYNVSFGVAPNKLYQNYQVYDDTTVTINTLNAELDYYFSVEPFNESGVTVQDLIEKTEEVDSE